MEHQNQAQNVSKATYVKPEITEIDVAIQESLMAVRNANTDLALNCTKHTHCAGAVCTGVGAPG